MGVECWCTITPFLTEFLVPVPSFPTVALSIPVHQHSLFVCAAASLHLLRKHSACSSAESGGVLETRSKPNQRDIRRSWRKDTKDNWTNERLGPTSMFLPCLVLFGCWMVWKLLGTGCLWNWFSLGPDRILLANSSMPSTLGMR